MFFVIKCTGPEDPCQFRAKQSADHCETLSGFKLCPKEVTKVIWKFPAEYFYFFSSGNPYALSFYTKIDGAIWPSSGLQTRFKFLALTEDPKACLCEFLANFLMEVFGFDEAVI